MAELLRIEIADAELQGLLQSTLAALQDPTDMLEEMGAVYERNVNLRFETKTDPTGAPWAALADSTLKSYERKYKGKVPGSLLDRHAAGLRNSFSRTVIGQAIEAGFAVAYAGYHETGSKDGRHPPKRSMLTADWEAGELGEKDRRDLIEVIESYLSQRLL